MKTSPQTSGTAVMREPEQAGDPHSPEETSSPQGYEEIRTPGETEGIGGLGETKGPRTPEGSEETKGPGETEGIRGPEETQGIRGPEEFEGRDPEGFEGIRGKGKTEDPRGFKGIRGPGETEGIRGPLGSEGFVRIRDPGDTEGPRDSGGPEGIRGQEKTEGIRISAETESIWGSGVPWSTKEAEIRGPKGYKTSTPNELRRPRERKLRASVRFELEEPEKPQKIRTPNSSQDIKCPKEIKVSERTKETKTSDSSQETRDPKETGDSERIQEIRDLEEVNAMAEKGCLSLTKYFLFVFNIFFFVLGSLVFCFGLWILIDKNSFASFLGLSFTPLKVWSYVLAISGALTCLLSFLGCLGALKEIRCLLGLYFSLLLLLFTTQITIGVLIYTQHSLLERKVKDIVLDVIENYRKYPDAYSTAENWDFVQFQLRCCGWTSPRDWLRASVLRPNGSAPSRSQKGSASSSDLLDLSPMPEPIPRVPCSCQNTSATISSSLSPAEAPRENQPAAGSKGWAAGVSAPGMPVVLQGRGSPGSPARLHSGELCLISADSGVYQEGCFRSIYTWLHNNLISIVGISLGLGLLEMAAAGLTLVLLPLTRPWDSRCQGLETRGHVALDVPLQEPGPRLQQALEIA